MTGKKVWGTRQLTFVQRLQKREKYDDVIQCPRMIRTGCYFIVIIKGE